MPLTPLCGLPLPKAVSWLVDSAEVRVIVLKGDGGNDFCSGADISEFAAVRSDHESATHYEALNVAAFAAIRQAPVPVIAAICGICFGGGLGLAAACDLRIADRSARFAIPAARLGLAYPVDGMGDITLGLGTDLARLALYTGQELDNAMLFPARVPDRPCGQGRTGRGNRVFGRHHCSQCATYHQGYEDGV